MAKIITIHYGQYLADSYIIDYSLSLGKEQKRYYSDDELVQAMTQETDSRRRLNPEKKFYAHIIGDFGGKREQLEEKLKKAYPNVIFGLPHQIIKQQEAEEKVKKKLKELKGKVVESAYSSHLEKPKP